MKYMQQSSNSSEDIPSRPNTEEPILKHQTVYNFKLLMIQYHPREISLYNMKLSF